MCGRIILFKEKHNRLEGLHGLTLWGVGAAFWGVVAGALALAVQRWRRG